MLKLYPCFSEAEDSVLVLFSIIYILFIYWYSCIIFFLQFYSIRNSCTQNYLPFYLKLWYQKWIWSRRLKSSLFKKHSLFPHPEKCFSHITFIRCLKNYTLLQHKTLYCLAFLQLFPSRRENKSTNINFMVK